jgi:hypothetical protein
VSSHAQDSKRQPIAVLDQDDRDVPARHGAIDEPSACVGHHLGGIACGHLELILAQPAGDRGTRPCTTDAVGSSARHIRSRIVVRFPTLPRA